MNQLRLLLSERLLLLIMSLAPNDDSGLKLKSCIASYAAETIRDKQ